ncbi:MAG: GspH/FimT family pseudopilin [Gammaproteobacteria bacterium]
MNGFSLIECIATLLCIAIIGLIALSTNTMWLQKQRSQTFIAQLVHDLQFARQQAILRNTLISLCPTHNFITCMDNNDWTQGYLIYTQHDERLIIRKQQTGTLTNSRTLVQFAPDGFSHSTNSTFIYTLGEIEHRVIINLQGRIRVE